MRNLFYVIIGLIFFTIFINLISAPTDISNSKTYNSTTQEVTISNATKDIAKVKLNTPINNLVMRGKDRLVAEFEINSLEDYSNVFKSMEFYNLKNNASLIRNFTYRYKLIEDYQVDVPIYDRCTEKVICNYKNGTEYPKNSPCDGIKESYDNIYDCQNGTEKETRQKEVWYDLGSKESKLLKGNITIGVFTDVLPNDAVEWIPTLFDTKISEWASWNDSFNNGLAAYWNFDNSTNSNSKFPEVIYGVLNGTAVNSTYKVFGYTNSSCKKGGCVYFSNQGWGAGTDARIQLGNTSSIIGSNKTFSFSLWAYDINNGNSRGMYICTPLAGTQEGNPQFMIGKQVLVAGNHPAWWRIKDAGGGSLSLQDNSAQDIFGRWVHYVFTYDGSKSKAGVKIYINGSLMVNINVSDTVTGNVLFGNVSFGSGADKFYGANAILDEVALYNRTLSAAEVTSLYDSGTGTFWTTLDTSYPTFSNNLTFPTNNSEYAPNQLVQFNVTIANTNGSAGISFDGTNYTMSNASSVFNKSFFDLSVGTYSYYFWAYGSGSSKNFNNTATYSYTIAQNSSYNLTITGTTPINYGDVAGISNSSCPSQLTCVLNRNNTGAITSPDNTILSAGYYNYTFNSTGNTNYSAKSTSFILQVNPETIPPNITITHPINNSNFNTTSVEFNASANENLSWCGLSIDNGANLTMTLNSSLNGANYTNSSMSQGYHNFTIICNDTSNNFGSASGINAYVDTNFPTVTLVSPVNNSFYNTSNPLFNITSSETTTKTGSIVPNLDSSLISWWRMDDTNGTTGVTDYMNINNGTVVGAVQTDAGKFREAYSFDGTNDEIDIPDSTSLSITGDLTISTWIKKEVSGTAQAIISHGKNDGNRSYTVQFLNTNYIILYLSPDGSQTNRGFTQSNTTITNNNWHHFVGTYNSTSQKIIIYLDGKNATGSVTGTIPSSIYNSPDIIRIGEFSSQFFNGSIDDLMIFNRSLSSSEVLGLYNATRVSHSSIALVEGNHTFNTYIQDYGGNINQSGQISFTVDATYPLISYGTGTAVDYANLSQNFTYINLSTTETNFANMSYTLYNSSDSIDFTGLVAYWNFDRNTSSVYDQSGYNNTGTPHGAVWNSTGKLGAGYSFDGSNDYIGLGKSSIGLGTNLSISAWIKTEGSSYSGGRQTIYGEADDSGNIKNQFRLQGNNISFDQYLPSGNMVVSTTQLDNGTWYHVAVVNNGTTNLFVNGALVTSGTQETFSGSGIDEVRIGYRSSLANSNDPFNGSIDDLMVFNRSLSSSEISVIYNRDLVNHTEYTTQNNSINFTNLNEGHYSYFVDILDLAGNYNIASFRNMMLDTTLPNATLLTPSNNSINNTNQNFTANLTDNLGIKNATLYIYNSTNSIVNSTIFTFTSGVTQQVVGVVVTLVSDIYQWFYQVFDWAGNTYTTVNNTYTQDISYPTFSNNLTFPTNNSEYAPNQLVQFNATIANTNGSAGISFDGTNYTMSNASSVFNKSFFDLSVGTYSYYFWAYGSGSSKNFNNTATYSYTIAKNNTLSLGITKTTPITYGTLTDFTGTGCPAQLSCTFNISNIIYPVGTISANYSTEGNANYTAKSVVDSIVINQNTSVCQIGFNITTPQTYPYKFKVFSNCTSAFYITRNGTIVANNSEQDLSAGSYNFTVFRNDSANYTNVIDTADFTITDSCTYSGLGNWDITCSDNCTLSTNTVIPNNISFTGNGTINIYANLTFNSTNQYIFINQGCQINRYSGSSFP